MDKDIQSLHFKESGYQQPLQKWHCGRQGCEPCPLGPDIKGNCQQDEKCQPVSAINDRLRLLTKWFLLVVWAAVLMTFVVDKASLLSPGPLSPSHATIDNCSVCHNNFNSTLGTWLHQAVMLESGDSNQQCLRCHIRIDNAFNPHNLSKAVLKELTESRSQILQTQSNRLDTIHRVPHTPINNALNCGICHREHKGDSDHLIEMSNSRCQVCHLQPFESFSTDHSQFSDYPYSRRTRIHFDHVNHFNKHFIEDEFEDRAPEKCQSCHINDAAGKLKQLTGFDKACSQCHNDQIRNYSPAAAKGIPVFAVPQLDIDTLQKRGFNVGQWPSRGAESFGPISQYLIFLSRQQREDKQLITGLPLFDLSDANNEQLRIITDAAWRLKEFYYDLNQSGFNHIRNLIKNAPRKDISPNQLTLLLNLLPKSTINQVEPNYFTNLSQEVKDFRQNKEVAYQPDNDQTNIKPKAPQPEQDNSLYQNDIDSYLIGDELELDDFPDIDIDIDIDTDIEDLALDNNEKSTEEPLLEAVDPEEWASNGGWYWDKSTLYYRPTGHADPFLKNWIDITGNHHNNPDSILLFNRLVKTDAVGFCGKCHSVDFDPKTNTNKINWYALRGSDSGKTFTQFSHSTHSSLSLEKGCRSCHHLDTKANYESGFDDRDPSTFFSNFKPMTIESCSTCHVSESAGDDCLQCHNYHIGDFGSPLSEAQTYSTTPEDKE